MGDSATGQRPDAITAAYGPLLRLEAIVAMFGLSRTTIYELMGEGTFPRPVRIGRRAVAWRSADIAAYISQCEVAA